MPSNPETKEELAEAFWQEVEKAFFADVPQLLVEAIEQHLLHASDFLQEFGDAAIDSNTIHPTSDQGACATNSNVIYEKGFPRFNRGGSLLLKKANSKAQTFLGPWEFLAAQRSLLHFLQNDNDDGHLKVAAVHEEGNTDASGTHYGNLDTFVSTLLGFPLADALSVDAREKIQFYGRCTHQKRQNSSADKGTKRAVSVSDELQQKISTVVPDVEENDSKQMALETSACNWDRDVCYLVKALGFGNCIYNDPFEAINFLENVYNQAQVELQSQKSNEFAPCILPQGYPQGVRFVFSFPPSGFLLSRYSSTFTKQITMTREWTLFLQTIFDYHVNGSKTSIKNSFSPKSTVDQKTSELENDDGGKVPVSERMTSEATFGLGYAVIGPQPLWRVSFLPQNRCTDNASTADVEQSPAASSKVSVVHSKTAPPSSRLISWPSWSQTATGVARECAIVDGVEVPRDAYLPFSSGTAFQAALTANVFSREKRKRFLSSKNSEVCYGNGDHEALKLPKLAEPSEKKPLAEYCSIDAKNVGQTDSSPCKNSELEVERLYLLRQLRCTVGAKYRLLQRLQEKIRAYVPPAKDYWRKVEESMVDLYRFEMFSSSSSGRFTYNLYRQYRDFDFLRMVCSLKGLTLPGWWNEQGLCSVCGSGIAYDDDPIVFCDGCFVPAHHGCVGYPTISVSPESIPTFPVPPGDLDELCEPVLCGNEDSGFISKGSPVTRRAVLQSVREQTAIRRATSYGQRESFSLSMAPTEAQEAPKKKPENVGVGVKRDGNLFSKRSLLKSGKESTSLEAETTHLTYKEREVVDNSPSSPMSVTTGRKGKRSNVGKCAEYKLGCRALSSRTKVADYFAAEDHHTGTVNPINQQPGQWRQETQTIGEVKTYQPSTSINSVDEEWYCDCCHLIMHQLNDVPTALAVIRHLAGPRTPKEFDDALAHERSSELRGTFNWYLPSLLDEDYQPQSLFKSDEGTSLTFGSELSETATQAANASVANGESGRKKLEKSRAVAQSTTSESPTPSSARDARPYRVRRSRYRLKKNKTPVRRYLRRGGGRADKLYVKTPERSKGVKQVMQESSRIKSLNREVEADNTEASIASTTSGLTVCAALQEKHLFNCLDKKRETTPDVCKNNSSVLTQKQVNVALLSSVREPELVVWRFSKNKFFSTLHTESPTYWYCWHVVVSVDEIEITRKSLQRQGSVNMDKRYSRNSSVPTKKPTEEGDCEGSFAKENEPGCEKHPGSGSFDVSGRHWRLKENISATEGCETPPSTVASQQKNESRYREFIVYIPCCALCGYDAYFKGGGVIKKALSNLKQQEFAHVRCATAVNGVLEPEAVRYTVEPGRAELRCTYCRQRGPAPVQCQHSQCARAYHVSCASQAQDCVTEFVEVRPHIYCSIHSKKKPPTQALRTYHQSLEKRRRVDRRLEEEALSTWLPSPFVSSGWLRSLFSTYSLSFNSLDALFPSPLTPLMAVNGRCGLISVRDRSLVRHEDDGPCATVEQAPIGSAGRKKMCCVARKDSLAKQQVAADACSKEYVFFIDAFNLARRFLPFYVLDETTWIVSGLAAGRCDTQLAFYEHGKAHQRAITAAELSLLAERPKQRGTMSQQPNGHSVKACFRPDLKHLLSPSYRLYLRLMGANSAESLIDTGMRLFFFLTGEIPTQALTEEILGTALTVAREWEKGTVPWIFDTKTSLLKDVTYSSPHEEGRNVVSALNLTKLSQNSVEPSVNVWKRWMCCCCSRDIKLLHNPKLLSSTKSGSATPKDRNLGATGLRCVVCGCVVCISCLQTYNNSYFQRDSTPSAAGEPSCAESAHDLEVSAVKNEHLLSTQHEALSSSTAVSAQLQNCEPNSEHSDMSGTMETRQDSALVRDDSNDSSTPLTHKNRRGSLTAARFTPRRKLRYEMESEKSTYNVSSNVEENITSFFCQFKDHPFLCARCHWFSQKKRWPLPLESCVLCNRNDGYLVPQNYGTFDREKRTSPVSGIGRETFGMVTIPARHRAEDKKQRLSNLEPDTCWVHPCCIEWFAPSKLKSQGFACIARTLKKYGCRFSSRNDESLLTSCASSFSPPSTVCDICNVSFGALWRCSDPRCSKAFHVSCARLWNCKFDEGHRKSAASETGSTEVVAARRAYCLEHSAQTSMNATTPTRKQAVYFFIKRIGVAMSSWSRFLDARLADRQALDIEKNATTVITITAVASLIQAFLSGLGCLFLLFPCGAPTVHQRWVVERESLGAFLDQSCRLPSHSHLPRVATEESKLAASLLGKPEQDCSNLVTSFVKSCDNSSTSTVQWTPVQNLIVDSTIKAQVSLFTELAEAERHSRDGLATEQWTTYLTKEDGAADGFDVFSSEDESVVVNYGNDLQNRSVPTAPKIDVDAWILENRRRVLSVLRPTHKISLGIAHRLWASAASALKDALRRGKDGTESSDQRSRVAKRPFPDAYAAQSTLPCRRRRASSHRATRKHNEDLEAREPYSMEPLASPLHNSGRQKLRIPASGVPRRRGRPRKYLLFQVPSSPKVDATAKDSKVVEDLPTGSAQQTELTKTAVASPAANKQQQQPEESLLSKTESLHSVVDAEQNRVEHIMKDAAPEPSQEKLVQMSSQQQTEMHLQQLQQHYHLQFQQFQQQQHPLLLGRLLPQFLAPDQIASTNGFFYDPRYMYPPMPSADIRCQRPFSAWEHTLSGKNVNSCAPQSTPPQSSPSPSFPVPAVGGVSVAYPFFMTSPERFAPAFATPLHHGVQPSQQVWCPNTQCDDVAKQHIEQQAPTLPADALPAFAVPSQQVPCYATQPQLYHPYQLQYMRQQQNHATHQLLMSTFGESSMRLQPRGSHSTPMGASYYAGRLVDTAEGLVASPSFQPQSRGPPASSIPTLSPSSSANIFQPPQ